MPPSKDSHSAFFYGTLMAPQVLHRVIHGSPSPSNPIHTQSNLTTTPAILPNHRRHRVKHADYPAILPNLGSSVRGTYVTGLTDGDMWRLDVFEGDEYERRAVKARVLTAVGGENGEGNVEGEEVECETYVWKEGGRVNLEDGEWDFAEFQREKMRFWVGKEGQREYAGRPSIIGPLSFDEERIRADFNAVEVDEAVAAAGRDGTGGRGANGHITKALEGEKGRDEVKNAI